MGFQHVQPFNLQGDKFLPIQSGSVDLTGTSVTVSLGTNVRLDKAVLQFSSDFSSNSDDPDRMLCRGEITDVDELTFTRNDSADQLTIEWFVWEATATNPMTVQRGTTDVGSSVALPVAVSIPTDVVLANAFPIISVSGASTTPSQNDAVSANITAVGNLELDVDTSNANSMIVAWQVINNPAWSVTRYTGNFSGTTTNITLSPAVELDVSYIIGSGTFDGGTLDGQEVARYAHQSNVQLRLSRSNSGNAWDYVIYVVDTNGAMASEHDNADISSGDTIENVGVTVDLTKAFCTINSLLNSMQTYNQSTTDGDHVMIRIRYTSDSNMRVERENSSSLQTECKTQSHQFN